MTPEQQDGKAFRFRAEGLTRSEMESLASYLKEQTGCDVEFLRWRTRDHAFAPGQIGDIQASAAPIVLTFVVSYASAHLVPAGREFVKAFSKKMGEATGDVTSDWFKKKFSGKSDVEAEVTLYGPDDKPIKNVKGRR